MKKILALIITLILIMNYGSFLVSAETTYTINEIKGKYKTQGRTEIVNNCLVMEWSASGIEFNAECSGDVSVNVETTRLWLGDTGGIYFTVLVDGVVQYENLRIPEENNAEIWKSNSTDYPFHITKTGKSTFVIANDLDYGIHNFCIYNQTEASNGSFGIHSISLNGVLLDSPKKQDKYIEFVGDSITAGLGNISVDGQDAPLYKDATRGWPFLTARKLNSDWSIIAKSGVTASKGMGWDGISSISMQDIYTKTRYFSNQSKNYDFSREPNIIVLGLGTNDIWTYLNCGKTINDIKIGFKDMLMLLRNENPNSQIVWIYGMMTNDIDSIIESVVLESGGEDAGFYTLKLPQNTSGGQGHPNLEAQEIYAEKLSLFLDEIWEYKDISIEEFNKKYWDGTTTAPLDKGNGVYEISTPEQLAYVISTGGGVGNTYNLTTDIYLNDITKIDWTTGEVETGYKVNSWYTKARWNPFNGHINGNGHVVYGLYYVDKDTNPPSGDWPEGAGLVPYMAVGSVKNIGVDYAYIYNNDMHSTAAIVGGGHATINADIECCFAGSNVTIEGYDVGGIAGGGGIGENGKVYIKNCYSLATLKGKNMVGGIIGSSWQYSSWIAENCFCINKATGSDWHPAELINVYETEDGLGGICVSKADLRGLKATETLISFDFEDIWRTTNFYPALAIFIEQKIGDSNNDKSIDVIDLVRLKKLIVNNGYDPYLDLNGNTNIQSDDLIILRKHLLGGMLIGGDINFPYQYFYWQGPEDYIIIVEEDNSALLSSAQLLKDYYYGFGFEIPIVIDDKKTNDKKIIIKKSSDDYLENQMKVSFSGSNLIFEGGHELVVDSAIRKFIRVNQSAYTISLFEKTTDFKSTILDGYTYVWGDEFEDSELDFSKWCFDAAMSGSADIEISYDKNVIDINNGLLKLNSIKYSTTSDSGIQYRVPYSVSTKNNMNFKYGYVEIKCRLPMFNGVWPSFWTRSNGNLGEYKQTNYFAEVDIFEVFGSTEIVPGIIKWYDSGAHSYWCDYKPIKTFNWVNNENIMNEYHIYGWEWTPSQMSMYVDGIKYMTFGINESFDKIGDMTAFHNPMHLMFNNHLISDASWQSGPIIEDGLSGLPGRYYIDYIRLYQKENEGNLYIDTTLNQYISRK